MRRFTVLAGLATLLAAPAFAEKPLALKPQTALDKVGKPQPAELQQRPGARTGIVTPSGGAKLTSTGGEPPLPPLLVLSKPNGFPFSSPNNRTFEYGFAALGRDGGSGLGRADFELWLRDGSHKARLVDVTHDVELKRRGKVEFDSTSNPLPLACRRRCVVLLTAKRGSQTSTVELPLIPTAVHGFRGHSRPASGDTHEGLGAYVLSFLSPTGHPLNQPGLGRILVDLEPLAGREPKPISGVDLQLVYRGRSGERFVTALNGITLEGKAVRYELNDDSFAIPRADGSFELRAIRGRDQLVAAADLEPSAFVMGNPSRVRDRR